MNGMRRKAKVWVRNTKRRVELQLRRLEQAPLLYAEVLPGVRRTLLPRFPYGVFFTVSGDLVYILAVIHNARNPARWPSRQSR